MEEGQEIMYILSFDGFLCVTQTEHRSSKNRGDPPILTFQTKLWMHKRPQPGCCKQFLLPFRITFQFLPPVFKIYVFIYEKLINY